MLDLILPLECGGCGAPSTRWCDACALELSVADGEPHVVNPRVDPQVPIFAVGRYAGARRQAILAMKERGRGDLPLGLSRGKKRSRWEHGVRYLMNRGGVPCARPIPSAIALRNACASPTRACELDPQCALVVACSARRDACLRAAARTRQGADHRTAPSAGVPIG